MYSLSELKRTVEDEAYAVRFGQRLEKSYVTAKSKGITDEQFATSIGVKRSALKKYLRGAATPSLRTAALAKRNHQISVPYGEVDLIGILERGWRGGLVPPAVQLRLPFSVRLSPPQRFTIELQELREANYELRIMPRSEKSGKKLRGRAG